MLIDVAMVALGLAVLLVAGDLLVRGAVGAAIALKIPALIVSLTIVAFGTSAPELFVSVTAVREGESGIALGNIIGSNIANVFLVLGLPALIYPISAQTKGLAPHCLAMLAATGAFAALAYGRGFLDWAAGAGLLAAIAIYVLLMWRRAHKDEPVIGDAAEFAESTSLGPRIALFLVAGLAGLPFGAHLLVSNGGALAVSLGVRDELIGLTIVAFGTSLPELATVAAAALHRKSDVAIGSVVGSNIFNLLAVAGAAGLAGVSAFDSKSLALDIPVMIGAAIVLSAFVLARRNIGRTAGAAMALAYVAFIAAVAATAGS